MITVESPDGGETWYHRTFYAIQWLSHEGAGTQVKIELYKDGSFSCTISASTDNDGYYKWFVPAALTPGTDNRIKITSTSSSSIYDYSDSYFSIAECFTPPACQPSFGGALVLDGDDDYAQAEDAPELEVGDETGESLTAEAWVNFASLNYYNGHIIEKPDSYLLHARRYYDSFHRNVFDCWGLSLPGYGGREICFWPSYRSGWYHMALVFNQETGDVWVYINGKRTSIGLHPVPTLRNSIEGLKVGEGLIGALDEVRISDVARYTGSTYTLPTFPFECDEHTRALWHLDEFEGATIFHDACGAVDNLLVGYNGAHTEGVPVHRVYLPLIAEQY